MPSSRVRSQINEMPYSTKFLQIFLGKVLSNFSGISDVSIKMSSDSKLNLLGCRHAFDQTTEHGLECRQLEIFTLMSLKCSLNF